MRRPPGAGTIALSKRPLRKPYSARITEKTYYDEIGKKHDKKKCIGYFATYEEAEEALDNYYKFQTSICTNRKDLKKIYELEDEIESSIQIINNAKKIIKIEEERITKIKNEIDKIKKDNN